MIPILTFYGKDGEVAVPKGQKRQRPHEEAIDERDSDTHVAKRKRLE
jgi:hypothetical protein